jgi:hypothetical protein
MRVEPIQLEVGRYWVESESTEDKHLVDLLSGECGCASWVCRQRAHKAKWGVPLRCKHVLAAREYCLDQFIETMKEHVLSQ